jgi:hypothetical protein
LGKERGERFESPTFPHKGVSAQRKLQKHQFIIGHCHRRLNSKRGKSMEIKETSKPFPFQTSGKRRATMAFSLSYKKELKALN